MWNLATEVLVEMTNVLNVFKGEPGVSFGGEEDRGF